MAPIATLLVLVLTVLLTACSLVPMEAPGARPTDRGPVAPSLPLVANQSADEKSAAAGAAAPAPASGEAEGTAPSLDRRVITDVKLNLSVDDAVGAAHRAEQVAEQYGGFVAGSTIRDSGDHREANLTLRVPADSLSLALADLRRLARKVTDESRTTQDVTEEYTDVESNLRNLQATEARLLTLMDKASGVNEVLAIQRELTGIRGQIERLEGRRRVLENRTSLASVALQLAESPGLPRDGWNPVRDLGDALAALGRLAQRVATAAIWVIAFLPVYGVPAAVGVWWLRRRRVVQTAGTSS